MRLRGAALYLALALPFLAIPPLLSPVLALEAGLGIALIVAIVSGIAAFVWVWRLYRASSPPRSIFFGMLVSALEVKVAFGAWIGYLIAAGLLGRVGVDLPVPPQSLRLVINGLVAVGLFVSAIYYAVTIELERRDHRLESRLEEEPT